MDGMARAACDGRHGMGAGGEGGREGGEALPPPAPMSMGWDDGMSKMGMAERLRRYHPKEHCVWNYHVGNTRKEAPGSA